MAALQAAPDAVLAPDGVAQNAVKVAFRVKGAVKTLELNSRVVLLDALRERFLGGREERHAEHDQDSSRTHGSAAFNVPTCAR
ncbi:MAG TPA: hypothetical protein VGF48_04970 [Thermoanaerobaculia bacterium]